MRSKERPPRQAVPDDFTIFRILLGRNHRARSQIVAHNRAALHYELNTLHFRNVGQRISGHSDHVGELALFDGAEGVLLVDDLGVDCRRHAQGIYGTGSPLDEDREHFSLDAVRAIAFSVIDPPWRRRGAAAPTEDYTGGQHFFPRHLHQAVAAVGRPFLQVPGFVLAVVQDRSGDGHALLDELFYVVIGGGGGVLNIVDPDLDRDLEAVTPIRVGGDPHAASVRLILDGSKFVLRGKRLIEHLAFFVEIERAGRMNFDVVDAVIGQLTDGGAHRVRSVRGDVWFVRREL